MPLCGPVREYLDFPPEGHRTTLTAFRRWCIFDIMIRTQVQFPDPLYKRLKEIAIQKDWSLSEVMRKAAEHFVERFPSQSTVAVEWQFPTLDCGGDFLMDPALVAPETEAISQRNRE